MEITKGTEVIGRVVSCSMTTATPTSEALGGVDECWDIFEVNGEIIITDIGREYVRWMLDKIARKIVKEAVTRALPAIYAEQNRLNHPKNQHNPTVFRNSNRTYKKGKQI